MTRTLRKLVFVEPKSTHLHIYSRVCIPRLGSVLLATIMRAKGYDVRVYIEDIHPVDMNEVLSADLVAISAITSTAPQSYRLADQVRAAGAIAVIGGTHTSFLPDEGLEHADFVVRGEGEFAFQELVEAIQGGAGFEKIQNLSYLVGGRAVHNPERPKIPNLDVNPIPDYHLIAGWKPGGVVSIATSRGCPFSCTFCSVPGMYGHAFRTHSVARVLEELGVHKGNAYTFFADDIFTANKKRVKELLHGMIARDLTPMWGAQVRTETVDDPELLQLMRDSNCFNVYVGFDSIYAQGEKYVISRNWQFYDGHHVVHQPRRISPYELQMGAIKAMEKFYSWRGIAQKLLKRDLYYVTIRYWGKKMIRQWWKDAENRAHVEWLRAQLYADAAELGHGGVRTVALPALLLQDSLGRLLERFLAELGVKVVPLAEAALEGSKRARETFDCLITPIVKRAAQEREEFHARLATVTAALQTQWEKLPRVSFPLVDGQGPVFEPFAKIGLLVTQNLDRIRDAYKTAGVAEGGNMFFQPDRRVSWARGSSAGFAGVIVSGGRFRRGPSRPPPIV